MVVFLLAACSGVDDNGFLSSSGRYDQPAWGDTGGEASTDTGDTASGGDDGAPVFTDIVASWEDYLDFGWVLQVTAKFTDDDDDIEGGECYIDAMYGEESTNFDGPIGTEPSDTCVVASGTLIFALKDLDTSVETTVVWSVQDTSRNVSAEDTQVVAPQ